MGRGFRRASGIAEAITRFEAGSLRGRIALKAFSVIVFWERDAAGPVRRHYGIHRSPAGCRSFFGWADYDACACLGIAGGTFYAVTGERGGN
jgi:hypothetical protein